MEEKKKALLYVDDDMFYHDLRKDLELGLQSCGLESNYELIYNPIFESSFLQNCNYGIPIERVM